MLSFTFCSFSSHASSQAAPRMESFWCSEAQTGAEVEKNLCLHPFLFIGRWCFISKQQWTCTSLRCSPACNLSQPGSQLQETNALLGSWPLVFVQRLVEFLCADCVTGSFIWLCPDTVFSGHVWFPEKELVEEGVDGVGTLHHDHVTSFLNDLQEGEQEDLETQNKCQRLDPKLSQS